MYPQRTTTLSQTPTSYFRINAKVDDKIYTIENGPYIS
jgi:hypothetical protein